MARLGISIDKARELKRKMHRMKIYEKDIEETFVRSSGPGGQNVNKVSTCVMLVHRPTRTRVKSQQGRSQGQNRYNARCLLVEKIEKKIKKEKQKKIYETQKRKRQNRKRSKLLKERILESKRQTSQKKKARQRIRPHKLDDYM